MTEIPKIVYDRLRAAGPERAHPDADLLTAFTEQTLSAVERDGVIEHLARCGECREIITLALPDADVATAPIADEADAVRTGSRAPAPRKLSFAWPSLRWAALAAGVVVVASVLLMRPGKLNQSTSPSPNQHVATTAQPVPGTPTVSPQVASSPIVSSTIGQSALAAKTDETRPRPELQLSRKLKPVTPAFQAQSGMLLADNKTESTQADKLPSAPAAGTGALAFDGSAARTVNETVEVSGAALTVEAAPSAEGNLIAQNQAPAIEKAKPAPQTETSRLLETPSTTIAELPLQGRNMTSMAKLKSPAKQTSAPKVTWAIAAGVLQRSLDGGQSWQSALRRDHPLLCYATHGADVWTGGQAGTLFYSADGGLTWVQVQPAIEGQQLSADITHIDVSGPAEVIISASNNETWSSTDGGKTWERK